jgi:hypothetical protein
MANRSTVAATDFRNFRNLKSQLRGLNAATLFSFQKPLCAKISGTLSVKGPICKILTSPTLTVLVTVVHYVANMVHFRAEAIVNGMTIVNSDRIMAGYSA